MKYKIKAKVWLWVGASGSTKGSWHFVTIPPEISEKIEKKYRSVHGGWGSLKVKATFGKTVLETSMFKNRREKNYLTYILPLKKKVRSEIGVQNGDILNFVLEIKV
jgi:hypothetical protein